jgi:molybdopterin adenylyltransferase
MPIRAGILCVPSMDEDAVQAVRSLLQAAVSGVYLLRESSAPSQQALIEEILRRWCDEEELDLVITVGGTLPAPGPSGREIVPEATLAVVERLLPGFSEEMRAAASEQSFLALLDRGVAGIRSRTLIVNLPAGVGPAQLFLAAIAPLIAPVVAHLQDQADAPQLADTLTANPAPDDDPAPVPDATISPTDGSGKLNAEEFAAFLQRSAQKKQQADPGSVDVST